MNVFFVRHGESEANAQDVFSSPDTSLTEKGKEQAEAISVQCHGMPVDVILTSEYKRTMQTAEIINEKVDKEIVLFRELHEERFPSDIIGVKHDDLQAVQVIKEMRDHADDPLWHYGDEENFHELRDRVVKGLDKLIDRPEKNILVVTHSNTMRMIMAIILRGPNVEPSFYDSIYKTLTTQNTGITYAKHNGEIWELVTWNNFTHLTEAIHHK